ncbi:MAG: primosomal protein N' [Spirochaetales bacterium]|nr:primosomal protein N' [Spirochaetales bacterium]
MNNLFDFTDESKKTLYLTVLVPLPVDIDFTYKYVVDKDFEEELVGRRALVFFRGKKINSFIIGQSLSSPQVKFEIKDIIEIVDGQPFFDERQISLARWLGSRYFCSHGEALSTMLPSGKAGKREFFLEAEEYEDYSPHTLSQQQNDAVAALTSGGADRNFYLYGITGAGKTEVYLRAADYYIQHGQSVIYLVPEIALTHQLLDEIKKRFGSRVAMLHSSITPLKKFQEWKRIREGGAMIVVGARSAIFAPVENLGLIIIDEEHESSYKSGNSPRYHARQVAMYLASQTDARILMGSATPSLEAYYLMNKGIFKKLELTQRLSGGQMPQIKIIDMSSQEPPFSQKLLEEIKAVKDSGGQSVLFLNRRGFSYFLHCKSCNYKMECPDCSVSLTYHKEKNRMQCHYCGYSAAPITVCPNCNSYDVGYSGFGTELIEDKLQKIFPHYNIARVDTDSVRKKGYLKEILDKFKNREIDILLGTQMVAKGLNFPGVKLVGIILADSSMNLPDFRAAEKTFALITQVAGRAGRFSKDGRVLIQTYSKDSDIIKAAAKMDVDEFYKKELQIREILFFPPFSRLFRIVVRSTDQELAMQTADDIGELLEKNLDSDVSLLGPAEAPILKVAKNYRYQIVLRSRSFDKIFCLVTKNLSSYRLPNSVFLEIDPDPVSLI